MTHDIMLQYVGICLMITIWWGYLTILLCQVMVTMMMGCVWWADVMCLWCDVGDLCDMSSVNCVGYEDGIFATTTPPSRSPHAIKN